MAKSVTKQLLPVFPVAMESLGLLHMPLMQPFVAAHFHPLLSAMSSGSPSLPSKSNRFQAALIEKTYKAEALWARALNVLSLLAAQQAELWEDFE